MSNEPVWTVRFDEIFREVLKLYVQAIGLFRWLEKKKQIG